jgi:ATP-dependent RNA helicase DHX37/DHR1
VDAAWLSAVAEPLVAFSKPLQSPPPRYDPSSDTVLASHEVSFGRHEWPLPLAERPHEDPNVRARCFAAALLSGIVLPSLSGAEFPFLIVTIWYFLQPNAV